MKTKAKNLAKLYKAQNPEYDDYRHLLAICWLQSRHRGNKRDE